VARIRYRTCEWVLLAYYAYVTALSVAYGLPAMRAALILTGAALLLQALSHPKVVAARDWAVPGLVLVAYREMDWFSAAHKARALERQWLEWDHRYLFDHGFREAVEALGSLPPMLFELSYLLVYGIGVFLLSAFYLAGRRDRANGYLTTYLIGTLLAYALFPYFPSDPPRVLFPDMDMPRVLTWARRVNLALVGGYGIHSSVFPSAHVSSAFSAAWGAVRYLPERPWIGRAALAYAVVVSLATIYGRYHYGADALAGVAVSLAALATTYCRKAS
jgi:membrane-associated phospholipid phosphatase